MKKLLSMFLLVSTLFLASCTQQEASNQISNVSPVGVVDYANTLKTHYTVDVQTIHGGNLYLCEDILSLRVLPGGALELVKKNLTVYVYAMGYWRVTFYMEVEND